MHVVQRLVERDRVAADGGNRATLGLPGIEVGRGEDDLVAHPPLSGVEHFNRVAACLGGLRELGPGVGAVAVQVEGAAGEHDAAVAHAHHLFIFDVVGERDGGLVRVGLGFGADRQLAVHHDPLGRQFQVGVVREAELAVDRHTIQWRRTDVEDHFLAAVDGDLVAGGGQLLVGPGGAIRPARRLDRRRAFRLSRFNDSEYADEGEGWNEQR